MRFNMSGPRGAPVSSTGFQGRSPWTLASRWEYQPGSELFVVYSDAHETSDTFARYDLQNRGLVVTINKLFRF